MHETTADLIARGTRARAEKRPADARAAFLEAVRQSATETDRPSLGVALSGLAQAERDIGNLEASSHHYANAVMLYRELGDAPRLAFALRHEADVLRENCKPADAESLYREAEGILRGLGDEAKLDLTNTLRGLALTCEALGKSDEAKTLWSEARTLYEQCGVEAGVAEADGKLSATSQD